MTKVKQSVVEEMAKAESSRTVPLPPPRVTQALFSPSAYAAEGMIARIRHALSKEFLEGGALKIRPGMGLPQEG